MIPSYFYKATAFLSLLFSVAKCSDELICAIASPKDEHTHQTVNCRFLDKKYIKSEINYQCTIYVDQELQSSNSQSVVQIEFSLVDFPGKPETANFFWTSHLKHLFESPESHSDDEFKYNQTVDLSYNSRNESTATIILYKLHYETVYKICVNMDETFEQKICCNVENSEEEEEANIYMVLVVLGVLLLIYAFVIIATKITTKKEKTIDELLETLPSAHVERLKSLFEMNEEEDDISEYGSDYEAGEEKTIVEKKVKEGKKVTIKDNFGYEPDSDETKQDYHQEFDDIQLNLYKEAQKFRKMSRMSISGFSTDDLEKIREKRTKNVKFNQDLPMKNEIDNIRLKVYNESNRRASIKPYKKPYDLGASDSE